VSERARNALFVVLIAVALMAGYRHYQHTAIDKVLKTADRLMQKQTKMHVEEAISLLSKAKDEHCGHFWVDRYLATAGLRMYRVERDPEYTKQVLRWTQNVLENDPHFYNALLGQGELALELGDVELARKSYREFAELIPDHPQGYVGLALVSKQAGSLREAETQFREAIKRFPPADRLAEQQNVAQLRIETYDELARLLVQDGRKDDAKRALDDAIAETPDSATLLQRAASLLMRSERPADALPYLERAVGLAQRSAPLRMELAKAYEVTGRVQDAVSQYESVLLFDPDEAGAHARLGALYARQERLEAARRHLRRVVELRPSAGAHYDLAVVFYSERSLAEARAELSAALKLDASHRRSRELLAEVERLERMK